MKIDIIVNLPPPNTGRQLRTTLGHTGYCSKFIKGYAHVTMPIGKIVEERCQFSMG